MSSHKTGMVDRNQVRIQDRILQSLQGSSQDQNPQDRTQGQSQDWTLQTQNIVHNHRNSRLNTRSHLYRRRILIQMLVYHAILNEKSQIII